MTIIKSDEDKQEFVGLVSDAFQQVMIPALDSMEVRIKQELGEKIDSLDRKFDAQQDRLDRHDKRITRLEEKADFAAS